MNRLVAFVMTLVIALPHTLAAVPARADLSTGLLAHYPFHGNAQDASGNGNHGTPNANCVLTSDRFGNASGAYLFNGINSQITVPSSPSLASPSTQITMCAWILLYGTSKVGSAFWPLLMKSNTTENAFMYRMAGGLGGFGAAYNNWNTQQDGPYNFTLDTWTFVAVASDGAVERYYVNGAQVGQTNRTLAITADTRPLVIGGDTPGVYESFWGKVDDVRIYNRALSPSEIQELAAQTTGVGDETVAGGALELRIGANPASGHVRLAFSLAQAAEARVEVYDLGGRRVRLLAEGLQGAGEHRLTWDGLSDAGVPASTGMYFVSARSEGWAVMKRVVLIR